MMSANWRWSIVLLLVFGGAVTAKAPVPDETKVPQHLSLVPVDAAGFITADFTGFFDEDIVKEVIKKFEASGKSNIMKEFEKMLGVDLKQISRVTVVMPATLENDDSPVVIISTSKPLDKDKVKENLTPKGTEKKTESGKVYFVGSNPGNPGVHFIGDQTMVVGEGKPLAAYLDKKLDGSVTRFPQAGKLLADNKLVCIIDLSDYGKKLQKDIPVKGADALFEAKPAILTLKGDKSLALNLNLMYKDEEQAKTGVTAAKAALDQLAELIVQGQKEMAKQAERPDIKQNELAQWGLKEATSLLKELEDNVKKADVAQKGKEVDVNIKSKASMARVLTLWVGMLIPVERTEEKEPKKSLPPPPKRR